jgi:hypothetical protein
MIAWTVSVYLSGGSSGERNEKDRHIVDGTGQQRTILGLSGDKLCSAAHHAVGLAGLRSFRVRVVPRQVGYQVDRLTAAKVPKLPWDKHFTRGEGRQVLGDVNSGPIHFQQFDLLRFLAGAEDDPERRQLVRLALVLVEPSEIKLHLALFEHVRIAHQQVGQVIPDNHVIVMNLNGLLLSNFEPSLPELVCPERLWWGMNEGHSRRLPHRHLGDRNISSNSIMSESCFVHDRGRLTSATRLARRDNRCGLTLTLRDSVYHPSRRRGAPQLPRPG